MKLERHPLSVLGGDIPESQFQELCTDIEKHGQRFPITVFGNTVLDGWHRFRACSYLEIKPKIEKFKGTPQEAAEFVVSANGHRRNHTDSQRAFFIAGAYAWVEQQGGAEPGSAPPKETKTTQELAKLADTSDRTIRQAKQVHRSGSKALKEAVQAGEVSVKKAAAVVDLPKSAQLKAATTRPEKDEPDVPDFSVRYEFDENDDAVIAQKELEYQEAIEKVMEADDKLAAANKEIARLAGLVVMLTKARDQYMASHGEAVSYVKRVQRENDRLRKALARYEPDKRQKANGMSLNA